MKRQHILLPAVLILLLLPQLTFGALPRYEIIDLGTLGGYSSRAYAINDVGQVVGYSKNVSGSTRAFFWENGIMTDLGTLGGDTSIAFDINNSGQVVGGTNMNAFLWDSTSGMIQLDNGVYSATADAINNYGLVVGRLRLQIGAAEHMFLWENHGMIDLGTILDSYFIYVPCISDSEQVVGTANVNVGGGLNGNAFLYENNIVTELGTLGGDYSGANGINSSGQIVGWSNILDGSIHAFLWDSSTGMRDLGTLGGNGSFAYAINDHGQVVGYSYTIDNDYDSIRAFIWNSNNGMVPLDKMLHADCEWKELRPQAINNRGQIVGQGITDTGEPHAFLMTPIPPKVIFVDADANGLNDGSSWIDAYNYLQDALAVARYGDEIRVAQGIYKSDQCDGIVPGDRTATFQLISGVTLMGGYAGFGEPDPNARDIELYETILSGDIGIPGDNSDNSYHVVTSSGLDKTAVLDGCTITGGNANGPYPHDQGGGILNEWGSPTVINCTISGNSADAGGGIYNCDYSKLIISNCTFTGNIANWFGGGMMSWEADSTLTNCTFHGNLAQRDGNAFACASPAAPRNLEATNCIFRDGGHEICDIYGNSTIKVTYSNVQGGWPDQGNIDTDPRFIAFGYWGDADNPDIIVEPNHAVAVWINGDYHLKSEGWRWYPQRNTWIWDDVTSKCIDAGNPASLLREELLSIPADPDNNWGQNLRINMGRYGGTARASIPPYGWAVLADLTNDGLVDFVDLAHWAEMWLSIGSEQPSDLDRNGTVDFADFSLVAQDWRAEAMWPPGQASNPNPADGATDVDRYLDLSWTANIHVISHDVYFGASYPPPFRCNQTATIFDPGIMAYETTYYWRIDEINKWGTTSGEIWSFTTVPSPSIPPPPP